MYTNEQDMEMNEALYKLRNAMTKPDVAQRYYEKKQKEHEAWKNFRSTVKYVH